MKINKFASYALDKKLKSNHIRIEFKNSNLDEDRTNKVMLNSIQDEICQSAQKYQNFKINSLLSSSFQNSSSQLAIFNDQILVAQTDSILFFDHIFDQVSKENSSSYFPNQALRVDFGDIVSLHTIRNQLIVRTEQNILIFQTNQQNFILSKVFSYSNILSLNFVTNKLFLCLEDKLILIDLISYQNYIILKDTQIIAGYYFENDYFYIKKNSNILRNLKKEYRLNLNTNLLIKSIFIINNLLCICGYHDKNKNNKGVTTYFGEIIWFNLIRQNYNEQIENLQINLLNEFSNEGDFEIQIIDQLCLVYGRNLCQLTFWNLEYLNLLSQNYDEVKLEILETQEILGLCLVNRNQYHKVKKGQESFSSTDEYPMIIVLDSQGFLNVYELINQQDFSNDVSQLQENELQNQFYINHYDILDDIQFTVIQNDPREILNLANPPFNLQLITQVNDSQIVFGSGKIDHIFHLHQNWISSANLAINYKHFQVIGHEREILILNPLSIQQILLDLPHKYQTYQITVHPCELIYGLYQFQEQILIQTNSSLYLCNYFDDCWNTKKILDQNSIKRIQILDDYILLKIKTYTDQFLLYQLKNDDLQQITTHSCDASCLFKLNNKISLLQILDNQLYILKDFENKEQIYIDIDIQYSKEYYIKQLHENHLYLSFATLDQNTFEHYILLYEPKKKQAKKEQHLEDLLKNVRCNHLLTKITESDWNITNIITQVAKFIVIIPNGIQDGFILQVCDQDLRTIDDQDGNPIQLPSFSHIIKGVSILNFVLPLEENLGFRPGFYKAKQDNKEFQYQCQPSILIYEFDEKGSLTIHRFLIIKLYNQKNQQPLLNVQFDDQQSELNQNTLKISHTESLLSLQPPPSPQINCQIIPSYAALITQQLLELFQQSLLQFHQIHDHDQFIPYYPIFTSQSILDDLISKYYEIQNDQCQKIKKLQDKSNVQQFQILKKLIHIPKIKLNYSHILELLKQLQYIQSYFSKFCTYIKIQLNEPKQQKKFINDDFFNYQEYQTRQQSRMTRKIVFDVDVQWKEPQNQVDLYIQKLCSSPKSKVKYLILDSNFQNSEFRFVKQHNLSQNQKDEKIKIISNSSSCEHEISLEEQSQTESMVLGFAAQSQSSQSSLNNDNFNFLDQQFHQAYRSPSKNPFDSESVSNIHNNQLVESIIFDNKDTKSEQELLNNVEYTIKQPLSQGQSKQKIEQISTNKLDLINDSNHSNIQEFQNNNRKNCKIETFLKSQIDIFNYDLEIQKK